MRERQQLSDRANGEWVFTGDRNLALAQLRAENERLRDVILAANAHGCRAMVKLRDRQERRGRALREADAELSLALDLLQGELPPSPDEETR